MEISELSLRNFKGIKEKTIEFSPNTNIFGANKAGKTTVADAVSWLFFDKDTLGQSATGRASFSIQPKNEITGEVVHKLITEAEGVFINSDQQEVTLKKVFKEKWVNKRKALEQTPEGSVTEYFIDGDKKTATAYKAKLSELGVDSRTFFLLTNPLYLLSIMDAKLRRKLVIEVSGTEVMDTDVIYSSPGLSSLPEILERRTVDNYITFAKSRISEIEKENAGKDTLANEKKKDLDELNLSVTNPAPIIKKLDDLRGGLSEKNTEISTIKNGGGVAKLRLSLVEIDGKLQAIANDHQKKIDDAAQVKRDELAKLQDELSEINGSIKAKISDKEALEANITVEADAVAALNKEWRTVTASTFDSISPCINCGALPEHHLNFTPEKFNEQKAQQIEDIVVDGTAAANEKKDLENLLSINAVQLAEDEDKRADKGKEIEDLFVILPEALAENDPDHRTWIANKTTIKEQIKKAESGNTDLAEKAEQEKAAIEEEIKTNEKYISDIETSQKIIDRITELIADKKNLAKEHETLLGNLSLMDDFNREKVSMLEEPINAKFAPVSFKMFHEAGTGGLSEVCEAVVGGVPYNSLNDAARTQAGLHCINSLSEYYNFLAPVIIDSRESVTEIPEMRCQVISLIVSPEDAVLRVEAV